MSKGLRVGLWSALTLVLVVGIAGCGGDTSGDDEAVDSSVVSELPVVGGGDSGRIEGEIVETMTSGRYTYVLVRAQEGDFWIAGPATEVAVGETITVAATQPMKSFHSESLDRIFEEIYFVGYLREGDDHDPGATDIMMRAHGGKDVLAGETPGSDEPAPYKRFTDRQVVGQIDPVADGLTIADVYERGEELAGRTVKVRGIVVKYTPAIMGVNWLHIQDGTGDALSFDLPVTTEETAEVGDMVVVEGVLASDRDFGGGYRFEVIIQGAKLTTE